MGALREATLPGSVELPTENAAAPEKPDVIIVPCPDSGHAGCAIVRRAAELVAASSSEVAVATPEDCRYSAKSFIVAVDGSSRCQSMGALRQVGVRPSQVVSAPQVLAERGALKPGLDLDAHLEDLAGLVADAIRDSLQDALEEARQRRRYQEEMAPIIDRFRSIWTKLEALSEPNGLPDEKQKAAVELLAKRSRNLFMKFDEVVPPAQWSEPHDLFQDALLCVAYASEGWASGDSSRWEQNMEKARLQIEPLLRRLQS